MLASQKSTWSTGGTLSMDRGSSKKVENRRLLRIGGEMIQR